MISPEVLSRYISTLGSCGARGDGGLQRYTYTAAWSEAQATVRMLMAEAGLDVYVDAVGNVFGRLPGSSGEPVILTGSHIDTVKGGGKYDGALGILAGIAALGELRAQYGSPTANLEVVALCEEEGSRFNANFLGSRAMLGLVSTEELATTFDDAGVSIREAMVGVGLDPDDVLSARRTDVAAFVELHIEQSDRLHEMGEDIGVVTVIPGVVWLGVTVLGRADHAGATSMRRRSDAFVPAAQMALAVREIALEAGDPAVITTGRWDVRPGAANIVPGEVSFTIDVRHTDASVLSGLVNEIVHRCEMLAERSGSMVQIYEQKRENPSAMDERLRTLIEESAELLGARWRTMPSGAGHDSQVWAKHVPSAIMFVPSQDGRSHVPEEYTSPEHCALGARVLAATLHRLAYRE